MAVIKGDRSIIRKNSAGSEFIQRRVNLVEGTNITLTIASDAANNETDVTITAAGGGGTNMTLAIAQVAHGLAVGDIVRLSGSATYTKAQANSSANAEVVGIVSAVADADNFTLHFGGRITTLSGLTANTVYFLSAATAGLLTATPPTANGQISKPVLIADTTTTGYFFNFRGSTIGNTAPTTKTLVYGLMGA